MFPPLFTAGAGLRVLIKFLRLFRCSLNLLSSSSISLGCSLALCPVFILGLNIAMYLGPGKMSLFIRFFPKVTENDDLQTEILKYFDNELKFRPKRDFNTAHVQLVGCH